jgi:CubicO group peptidase (beta-lactamase class C family)
MQPQKGEIQMKTIATTMLCLAIYVNVQTAYAQEPTIDTWQKGLRAEGLANLHRILPNLMVVNAEDVFALNYQARDYDLHEIPSVARVMNHPAVSGFVVITEKGDVLLEHYRNQKDRNSSFSDQSSTKSMGYILLVQALKEGKIRLTDKVEKYIPEIGSGFKGRTIADVAAMAVNHTVAELAAYTGDPAALKMFDRDERMIGLQRNKKRETLVQFIQEIDAGGENGSNKWQGKIANYATINTNVLGLALERATKVPLAKQVRDLLHRAGGENPMYMGTDFDGVPMIGASLVSSAVDFARYGRLLIEDKKQVLADRSTAKANGEVVPAELTHVESRYYKSVIFNDYGLGHGGWGGQLIWADPESGVIVAINSQLASKLPAPYPHYNMLYAAAYEIVKHQRAKKKN